MENETNPIEPTHAEKFDKLLTHVLSVPKVEIDKREAEYKKRRSLRKKSHG